MWLVRARQQAWLIALEPIWLTPFFSSPLLPCQVLAPAASCHLHCCLHHCNYHCLERRLHKHHAFNVYSKSAALGMLVPPPPFASIHHHYTNCSRSSHGAALRNPSQARAYLTCTDLILLMRMFRGRQMARQCQAQMDDASFLALLPCQLLTQQSPSNPWC